MFAVYENGQKTMVFETYEEACDYLDNVFQSDCWHMFGFEIKEEN